MTKIDNDHAVFIDIVSITMFKRLLNIVTDTNSHTYAKATNDAKLSLQNKCQVTHILPCRVWWCPA